MRVRTESYLFRAVLIAALIVVAVGSTFYQYESAAPKQEQKQSGESAKDVGPPKSLWARTIEDAPSFWTAVLAGLTVVLAGVGAVQIYYLRRTDETARLTARAALKAATAAENQVAAAIAAQLPILRIGIGELLRVDHLIPENTTYGAISAYSRVDRFSVVDYLTIENVGKSPAIVTSIDLGWCVFSYANNPTYISRPQFREHVIQDGHTEQITLGPFNIAITDDDDLTVAKDVSGALKVFCRVEYTDFVGAVWSQTATWRWGAIHGQAPHDFERDHEAPRQYNERRKIWAPDEPNS